MKQNLKQLNKIPLISSESAKLLKNEIDFSDDQPRFYIKTSNLSRTELEDYSQNEINLWKMLSSSASVPLIVPTYYGSYLEKQFPYENFNCHMVFESFTANFSHVMSLDQHLIYDRLFESLVLLQKMEICPLFLTPSRLFGDEGTNNIKIYDLVYAKDFLRKFRKRANRIPEEEWVYFAPELRNVFNSDQEIRDFNPYKAIIYSLIMLLIRVITRKNPKKKYTAERIERLEKNGLEKSLFGELETKYKGLKNLKKLLSPQQNQRPDAIEIFLKEVKNF